MSYIKVPADIDIAFIEAKEGFSNRFIYPGGASGPTIGNGIDIGHLEPATVGMLLEGVDAAAMTRIKTGYGLSGESAKAWVSKNKDILVSSQILKKAGLSIYGKFWSEVIKRFPGVDTAPKSVKTAVLSCCYNRGTWNKGMAPWVQMISAKNWKGVADSLWSMQQDHPLNGIRTRRREEASMIYKELGVGAPK